MSLSPRFLDQLAARNNHQEVYYYMQRCLFNVSLMRRVNKKLEVAKMQYQAESCALILDGKDWREPREPPEWLSQYAPEEATKVYGPTSPALESDREGMK